MSHRHARRPTMTVAEEKANMDAPYHAWTYEGRSVWRFTGFDELADAQAYAKKNNSRDVSGPNRFTWKNPDFNPMKQPKD